jgi:NADH dehydrogenase FAD-containing subunit
MGLRKYLRLSDHPNIPQEQAKIVLVEAGGDIFSMFKKNLRT